MAKLTDKEWATIEIRFISGESAATIAEDYDITHHAISQRSKRKRWKTAKILRKEAEALLGDADAIDKKKQAAAIKKKWNDRRDKHLETMHEKASEMLEDVDLSRVKVKSLHDLNLLDGILRRTVGLDEVGKENQSGGPTINIALFDQIKDAPRIEDKDDIIDI